MKLLGQTPTPDQLNAIVQEVDSDGSGTIDFDEFLVMMVMQLREEKKGEDENVLRDCFRLYDIDGDNYIDYPEFKRSLEGCDANPKIEEWRSRPSSPTRTRTATPKLISTSGACGTAATPPSTTRNVPRYKDNRQKNLTYSYS